VPYWVDISYVKECFPSYPSLIHVNWMKWLRIKTQQAWIHDIQGVVVYHSWVPLQRVCGTFVFNENFPRPSFFHSLFLSCFKDELKAIVLTRCPYNDSVTHKYLAEMRRLARDENPFLPVVQLRATTLDWW
jgi:hypothetical protein